VDALVSAEWLRLGADGDLTHAIVESVLDVEIDGMWTIRIARDSVKGNPKASQKARGQFVLSAPAWCRGPPDRQSVLLSPGR
jgi:hypothetical protein